MSESQSILRHVYDEANRALRVSGAVVGTELGVTELAVDRTVTVTQADITGLAVTVTVPSSSGVYVEAELPALVKNTAAGNLFIYLQEDGVTIAQAWQTFASFGATNGLGAPMRISRSRAPSAASHTYKIQASVNNNTATVFGTGGAVPFIRVTAR